jgi:hypothetical protein
MNAKSNAKNPQPTVKADVSDSWQNFIVEELSDEAQTAVSGGRQYRVMTLEDIRNTDWSIGIG